MNMIAIGLCGIFYCNQYAYLFEKDVTKLRQAYTNLELHKKAQSPMTMVKSMQYGILIQNNPTISYAKQKLLDYFQNALIKL